MKSTAILFSSLLCACGIAMRAQEPDYPAPAKDRTPVIIETDMGNDIDDALAVALAYTAVNDGRIDLLMLSNHKKSPASPDFLDILNTWYGHPETPVANSETPVANSEAIDYTVAVTKAADGDGKPLYARSGNCTGGYMKPVKAYRKLLSGQADGSVVIVSLGFGTTLAQLLDSPPDEYSRLDGRKLVARKVKYLSLMAGSYGVQDTIMVNGRRETLFDRTKKRCEFNVANDIASMRAVLDRWPTRIYQNPFEIGKMVMFPGAVVEKRKGPVYDAYRAYKTMPYDRPSWDILAVAFVLEPRMFSMGGPGTVTADDGGYCHFYPKGTAGQRKVKKGNAHYVLTLTQAQADSLKSRIIAGTAPTAE